MNVWKYIQSLWRRVFPRKLPPGVRACRAAGPVQVGDNVSVFPDGTVGRSADVRQAARGGGKTLSIDESIRKANREGGTVVRCGSGRCPPRIPITSYERAKEAWAYENLCRGMALQHIFRQIYGDMRFRMKDEPRHIVVNRTREIIETAIGRYRRATENRRSGEPRVDAMTNPGVASSASTSPERPV